MIIKSHSTSTAVKGHKRNTSGNSNNNDIFDLGLRHSRQASVDTRTTRSDSPPVPASTRIYHVLIAFIVLIVVITTVTLSIILSPTHQAVKNQHNILLIIADDLGYNDVGYNNVFNDIRTPYIDKLARESIKLTRHYVQPMCSPTRAALFTGRYPFRYGMGGSRAVYYGSEHGLDTKETLLPQAMREAGYDTYLIGKWHLGFASWAMTPVKRGFNYFFGTYGGSSDYYTHLSYEGPRTQGYDLFEDKIDKKLINKKVHKHAFVPDDDGFKHRVIRDKNETFSELLFTQNGTEIIENSATQGKPFFLVMSYMNPHAPIAPLPEDYQQNSHIGNENRRKYAGLVTSLDYGVGRLITALEETKLLNKTVIIFMSDNGGHIGMLDGESLGSSNYPLRGAKTTLYEGGVKVPAFIRIPGVTGDYNYTGLFHVTDWFPTIASFAGLRPEHYNANMDGIDHSVRFSSIAKGLSEEELREAPAREQLILDIDPVYQQAAVIHGGFKLLLGNPAPLNFSAVYPLLPDNKTHYDSINGTHIQQQYARNEQRQQTFAANPRKCLNVSCIPGDITMYDISVDISEDNDISWRFPDKKSELYKILLDVTREKLLPEPIFFEDENKQALDKDNIWTPWID